MELEMSMLPLELNALIRNVQMLLELESCLPRERLLAADELRALSDAAKSIAFDESAQGCTGHTEFGRDVVDREISPQQRAHFGDAISELGVELRSRRAVRDETCAHDVASERGDCGWPPHAASPSCAGGDGSGLAMAAGHEADTGQWSENHCMVFSNRRT